MKEREIFPDRLKIAATCAVVLLHTVTGVTDTTDMTRYPFENKVFLILLDLICWCVPVFVMISGYLFLNPLREVSMRQMLTKYCRRIVLALFLFGVPYAWLEQIATERTLRPGMIAEGFLMVLRGESWSHMWYLYLILILYLLTPAMRKILVRAPRASVYAILVFLFLGSSVLPYIYKLFDADGMMRLPDGGIYFFYYICGGLFASAGFSGRIRSVLSDNVSEAPGHDSPEGPERPEQPVLLTGAENRERTEAGKRRMGIWLLSFAVIWASAMACSRLSGGYILQMAYNYPFTVVLSLLIFGGGFALEKSRPATGEGGERTGAALTEQAAALSFTVYLIHPVFLNTAYKFLHVTLLDFPLGISLPVFFAAVLLLSVIGARILRKIIPLRKYVL